MTVTLLTPAVEEVLGAIDHYEAQAPGLGAALDADLRQTLRFVGGNPELGSPHGVGLRRVLLHRFPYSVIYRTLEDRVLVVAFAHQKRRPGYWMNPR